MRTSLHLFFALALVACGDGEGTDGGTGTDAGGTDAGDVTMDGGGGDDAGGGSDGGGDDGGGGSDGGGGADAGDFDAGGSGTSCTSDADCATGTEWCEGGRCVACDNSGLLCDIACMPSGWSTYTRNGCNPCECAPPSECTEDSDCRVMGDAGTCVAGEFCWCAARTPDCCMGNICAAPGCTPPPPEGCIRRGCARGVPCIVGDGSCASSGCDCDGSDWVCTEDCGGGRCASSP